MTIGILAGTGRPDVVPSADTVLESPDECRLRVKIYPILTREHLLGRNLGLGQCGSHDIGGSTPSRLLAFLGLESLDELLDLLAGTLP